jgi:hypothetical protein
LIIAKLYGGLGNQMFQYAFGRFLAIRNNVELKLDVTTLLQNEIKDGSTYRNFELDKFKIQTSIANEEDIQPYKVSKFKKAWDYISLNLPFHSKHFYLREPHFYFFAKAIKTPKDAYIDGYWQSEKYFESIRMQLLNEFTPVNTLSTQTLELLPKIKNAQSVSVHVRRGDYVSTIPANTIHGTCKPEYYDEAIKFITEKLENPILYVFSDDPDWFEKNIKTKHSTVFVKHNIGQNSYEDIYLMSQCQHNIIANSSFSWWGAWLNDNKNKIVVAPKNWFTDNGPNAKDLICKSWIQI